MRRLPLRSPPRVRGKVPVCCPEHRKVRITPAYAGKRDLVISGSGDIEDHPRVCGEKFTLSSSTAVSPGSPPRMRGKADGARRRSAVGRITPAYAGKRGGMWVQESTLWDHPRVCGEKPARLTAKAPAGGSPPRMRGKVHCSTRVSIHHGITPAYAGKRALPCRWPYRRRDHPRVCGEKGYFEMRSSKTIGAPPRMRGKGLYAVHPARTRGITPAYAGKRAAPAVHGSSF